MPREEFDRLRKVDEICPDALFPVMDYDMCKYIWENSPLIARLTESVMSYTCSTDAQTCRAINSQSQARSIR